MTTPLDYPALREAAELATPGPWFISGLTIYALSDGSNPNNRFSALVQRGFVRCSGFTAAKDWNVRTSDEELQADAVLMAASKQLLAHNLTLLETIRGLREIAEAAHDLVMKPGGLRNDGRALVVVERADKTDPHFRLCALLEAESARAALSQHTGEL